ncbi:MAG: YggS family pyridoxal phosphate-dependent enzyme [Pelistega sp.]|nr:YggS family pyridoxal phosphate-dependent enzyme [Pelistega sp.]
MLQRPVYPKATSLEEFRENFAQIQARIVQACERVGRDPGTVRLLPVSKTVDEERIRMVASLGYSQFGENKVQEAQTKADAMQDLNLHWAVIGHLQTNKVKYVARFASEFQALDSLRVAELLDARLEIEDRYLDVHIQINTSGEESKYGLAPQELADFIQSIKDLKRIRVKGLMTLAILSGDPVKVRQCFVLLRQLREQMQTNLPEHMRLDDLSMGMSGDFEIAIEEGATTVRIGQALFGARALPDSHYWPGIN